MWVIGESSNDAYMLHGVEIDRRIYNWEKLEIRSDGYFWFGGVRSDITLTLLAEVLIHY